MKKEFPIKDLKSIEFDHENGVVIANYVEEKSALEIGKWYVGLFEPKLYIGNNNGVGLDAGTWNNNIKMSNLRYWKPADMDEVQRLLIAEAEKKYSLDCSIYSIKWKGAKPSMRAASLQSKIKDDGFWFRGNLVLSFKTGKWAEIVEEKKPLYTNILGTEFFEGDKCYWVIGNGPELGNGRVRNNMTFKAAFTSTEIMTKKECYQYLADHCEE